MDANLGGWKAGCMFVLTLSGYVIQSQFAQHVQVDLHYRQPYFIFWLAHSCFIILFPLQLAGLCWLTGVPAKAYIAGLKDAIHDRLLPSTPPVSRTSDFPTARFVRTIVLLTAGITCPGLLWYVAVSLTPISDVTAILNTNAFWAYLLSVWMGSAPWQPKRLIAVAIAVIGVFFIVYGGTAHEPDAREGKSKSTHLLGDTLTLLASMIYALYQTAYKRYVALPNRIEGDSDDDKIQTGYEPLPVDHGASQSTRRNILSLGSEPSRATWKQDEDTGEASVYPAFSLHPNFITTCLGLTTLLFLWPPIIIAHYTGIETFRLPDNVETWLSVIAVGLSGVAYNAGFMVLLSLWGPTLATVGNLLTIVLVLISDTLFGHGLETLTIPSVLGASAIVAAFGALVAVERNVEMERLQRRLSTSVGSRLRQGSHAEDH